MFYWHSYIYLKQINSANNYTSLKAVLIEQSLNIDYTYNIIYTLVYCE